MDTTTELFETLVRQTPENSLESRFQNVLIQMFEEPAVSFDGSFFVIEEKYHGAFSVQSISGSSKTRLTSKQMLTLPHDLVLSQLKVEVGKPDTKLRYVFGAIGDEFDNSSPDISTRIDNRVCIAEVGTTRSIYTQNVYKDKLSKYAKAIRLRDRDARFFVLAVSLNNVLTNLNISMDLAQLFCSAYVYGITIQSLAEKVGFDRSRADDLRLDCVKDLKLMLSNVPAQVKSSYLSVHDYKRDFNENYEKEFIKQTLENQKQVKQTGYESYVSRVETQGKRTNLKRVAMYPYVVLTKATKEDFYAGNCQSEDDETLAYWALWTQVLSSIRQEWPEDKEDYMKFESVSEDYFSFDDFKKMETEQRREEKREANRCKIQLDDIYKGVFAECGLYGKTMSKLDEIKAMRDQKKKGFSLKTDTQDIDDFIKRDTLQPINVNNPILDRISQLSPYYSSLDDGNMSEFLNFLTTELGHVCSFLTCMSVELNANLRKSVSSKEWILTFIRPYNIPMIMHNTGSNKHSFFSLLIPNSCIVDSLDLPFNHLIKLSETLSCTALVSTRKFDMTTMMPTLTRMFILKNLYSEINADNILKSEQLALNDELNFSFLVQLENKESTITPLMNVRYMYMKVISGKVRDPFAVLSKFPEIIRSRLLVWSINKIIYAFQYMIENPPSPLAIELTEDDDPKIISADRFFNLISWISGKFITKFEVALNLSYLGVLHEKEKGETLHGYLKIFSKVISEEIKMRHVDRRWVDPELEPSHLKSNFGSHEFSQSHVRNIANVSKSVLHNMGYTNERILEKIYNDLAMVTFEDLATLKASAEYKNLRLDLRAVDKRNLPRIKALEAVLRIIDEFNISTTNPFLLFLNLLERIKDMGGIIVNLFKKHQLNGTREIFVLNMLSRILIRFVEGVSRSICELLPNEFLTKGRDKAKSIVDHFSTVSKFRSKITAEQTSSHSADCTTWCQRFVMNIFGVFFHEFLSGIDKPLYNALSIVLNLVTEKHLELPEELLALFSKKRDILSYDISMNELKDQFLGRSQYSDLVESGSGFLKNTSNFMQGILHYTSSMIHSSHLLWFTRLSKRILRAVVTKRDKTAKFVVTSQVSSDDSGLLTTVVYDKLNLDHKVVDIVLDQLAVLFVNSQKLFGAKLSLEKSAIDNRYNVYEFNSSWQIMNTTITPKIKWAIATCSIRPEYSTLRKMSTDNTLIRDFKSNGGSIKMCSLLEIACWFNHYLSTGIATLNTLDWNILCQNLLSVKHPSAWFYLLSHSKVAGVLGSEATMYYNCLKFQETRKIENAVRRKIIPVDDPILGNGITTTLSLASARKYKSFMSKIKCPLRSEISSKINNQPHLMFLKPMERKDQSFYIHLKAIAPGVEIGFETTDGSLMMTTSTYILSKPVITYRTKEKSVKLSLPALIRELRSMSDSDDMPYFEFQEVYDEILSFASSLNRTVDLKQERRKTSTHISMSTDEFSTTISLLDMCRHLWFGMDIFKPRFLIESSFRELKIRHPWLTNDYQSSFLEYQSIYGECDDLSFCNVIKKFDEETISIHGQTCSHKQPSKLSQIKDILRYDYYPGTLLQQITQPVQTIIRKFAFTSAESYLSRIKCYPFYKMNYHWHTDILKTITNKLPWEIDIDDTARMSPRQQKLFMLASFANVEGLKMSRTQSHKALQTIVRSNLGRIMGFTHIQKKNEHGEYLGYGTIVAQVQNLKLLIHVEDKTLLKIETNSISTIRLYKRDLRDILVHSLGLTDSRNSRKNDSLRIENGSVWFDSVNGGVPIDVSDKIPSLENIENLDYSLCISKMGNLSLRIKSYNIILDSVTYSPRNEFTNDDIPLSASRDYYATCWMKNKPITQPKAIKLLSREDRREWSQSTLKKRLIKRGYGRRRLDIRAVPSKTLSLDNLDEMLDFDDFDEDFFDEVAADMFDDDEEELPINSTVEDELLEMELDEDEALIRSIDPGLYGYLDVQDVKQGKVYEYETVFWDTLIDNLNEQFNDINRWLSVPDDVKNNKVLTEVLLEIGIPESHVSKPPVSWTVDQDDGDDDFDEDDGEEFAQELIPRRDEEELPY